MTTPTQSEIPEDEREPVVEKLIPATKSNIEYSLRAVVGQIISDRVLNKKAVNNTMFKTWEEYKDLYIIEMNDNKFLFTFPSVKAAEEVLEKAQWFVMNQVLSLQRWEEGIAFQDIDFNNVPFWIQIHGLSREDVNPANGPIILNRVGKVLEVEDPLKTGATSRHFVRARVAVDVQRPLWSGCWLQKPGNVRVWVHFKYERLQSICYNCGRFGHEQRHCETLRVMAADNKQLPKYGPFLSVTKPKLAQKFPSGDSYKGKGKQQQHIDNETQLEGNSSNNNPTTDGSTEPATNNSNESMQT